jgi:hypothetical protein
MKIKELNYNFYQIEDVFDPEFLNEVKHNISSIDNGETLHDGHNVTRKQIPWPKYSVPEIDLIQQHIESICGKVYSNGLMMWRDSPGYCNDLHKDYSVNLNANVQVYVGDGDCEGTSCYINNQWYTVPYKYNTGYIMIDPTLHLHGMKKPSNEYRYSLYQSFRKTPNEVNDW